MTIPAGWLTALVIAGGTLAGIVARMQTQGDLNLLHSVFCLFFSVNLLVCYWEVCLYLRRGHIGTRAEFWRETQRRTGRSTAREFFDTRIALNRIFSLTFPTTASPAGRAR